jgi:hypothetical protein
MPNPRWKHLDRTLPKASESPTKAAPASQAPPEVTGAAAFLQGQQTLAAQPLHAARHFGEALEAFRALPPSGIRTDLLTAAFIAQSVAFLAGGAFDSAQLAYTRLRTEPLPKAAQDFAHRLFQIADELRELPPEERHEALTELIQLVERIEPEGRFDFEYFLAP